MDCAALACARTNDVKIENNIIMNSYTKALSVEYDDDYCQIIDKVTLIRNQIVGSRSYGIWINTGCRNIELGNNIIEHPWNYLDEILLDYRPETPKCPDNPSTPSILEAHDCKWSRDFWHYATICNDYVYILNFNDNKLYKITPYTWSYTASPDGFINMGMTEGMTGLNTNGMLYLVQNGILYRVNTDDWSYTPDNTGTNWSGTKFMASATKFTESAKAYINIIRRGVLHSVEPDNFSHYHSSTDWSDTRWMCSWGEKIYIMTNNGRYYEIDPITLEDKLIDTPP